MPLRALFAGLRGRNWGAVLGELLIVVAGVYLGLQASNWNDSRKEMQRGREYLQRLHDELQLDARSIDHISGFWEQVRGYGAAAIAHAENGVLYEGSSWKTVLAYYQASQVWPYRKSDVTFQEIRSAGDLGLIRNPALRADIARHYSAAAGSQVVEVLGLIPRYREHVRGVTPWPIQEYIWSNCYGSIDARQVLKDCESPLSEAEARAVLEAYRREPGLTEDLRFWMVNLSNGRMLMRDVQAQANVLVDGIDAEMSR
jgi:hypothetical protein